MRFLRAIFRIFDLGDLVWAVVALGVVVVLLMSGRVPHDLELLTYAFAGLLVVLSLIAMIWGWRRGRRG